MNKIDRFILCIPYIGLVYMFVIMGDKNLNYERPSYNETKLPIIIQFISIFLTFLIAFITK